MRKFYKIIFPLFIVSSLLMVGVQTTNATSSNLGIKQGGIYDYTFGWNYGLNVPDSVWNEINSIASLYNITIDAKQIYSVINSLPHVFNMKAIVENYTTAGYNTTYQLKLTNETNYMDLTPFLNNLNATYNNTMQKYSGPFNSLTNGSNFFSNMTNFIAGTIPSILMNVSSSVSYNSSFIYGNSFYLFMPTDWNYITQENAQENHTIYPSLHQFYGLPNSVYNFTALLKAMGITTFNVQDKSVLVKYNFADMNQDWLNYMINSSRSHSYGTNYFVDILSTLNNPFLFGFLNYLPNWLWHPFNDAINFDQFLQTICSELNLTMTTPKMTAAVDLVYNNDGILQNAHSEYDLSTTINGTSVDFNPQFDISAGTHNTIDANWNPSTVPGYPIWLIGLASLAGMTAVVLSIKKKRTVKFNRL